MKIFLINVRRSENPLIPLGLLYLGGVLERNGYKVKVYDVVDPNDESQLVNEVLKYQPDVLGFSFLTTAVEKTNRIIQQLRTISGKSIFISGGVHSTALPQDTFERLGLDYVICGEGEVSLLEFCNSLRTGSVRRDIAGLVYREDSKVTINPVSGYIEDLDSLPLPAWHLVDMEKYLFPPGYIKGLFYRRTAPVLTSRGCPARCIFCSSPNIFGRMVRRRSVRSVVDEIKTLKDRYRIDGVFFLDDTFTVDRNWIMDFCKLMEEERVNLDWSCQTRVNVVSREILERMKDAGCVQVDYGIESGSAKILKNLKKGTNIEQIKTAFKLAREVGLRTYGSVLLGSPGETWSDVQLTKKLLAELRPSLTLFNFLTPFPGSELYDMALKNNWIRGGVDRLHSYDMHTTDESLMISELSPGELSRARSELKNKVFFQNYLGYLNPKNLSFILEVMGCCLLHPVLILRGLRKAMRSRAFDDFSEAVYFIYCQEKRRRK